VPPPLGNTAARIQPGGRMPDSSPEAGRLQCAGRPENIERRALRSNLGSLYCTVGHNLPPVCLSMVRRFPPGGHIMR